MDSLHEYVPLTLAEVEREHITYVLNLVNGNRVKAAEILGISARTVHRKIKEHGLERRYHAARSGIR